MQPYGPLEPVEPRAAAGEPIAGEPIAGEPIAGEPIDVGAFRQGSPLSRWALARYLVGRAIGESVGWTLLLAFVALLALAVVAEWVIHSTLLSVLLVIVALGVLLVRTVVRAVLRSVTAVGRYGPIEARLRELVSDTRGDVKRELRRLGLPSHALTLPLLGIRMIGRRRKVTLERLRGFEIDRAVPAARLDELHMLLRDAADGPGGAGGAGGQGQFGGPGGFGGTVIR